MSRILLLLLVMGTLCTAGIAQSPQRFNYQAIIRNTGGAIVASQPIGLRFSIRDLTANGNILYSETQQSATNTYGLLNLQIGGGTVVSGTMNQVNWATGKKFLQVEADNTGGTNYTELATVELVAVPYAMHAERSVSFTGPLAGDITGTQTATQINNGAVSSAKLADNSVTPTKIPNASITADKIAPGQLVTGLMGAKGEISIAAVRNILVTRTGNNIQLDVPNGGDITAITAGAGLMGGGTEGDLSLAVAYAGNGIQNAAARSDHNHINQTWNVNGGTGLTFNNAAGAIEGIRVNLSSTGFNAAAFSGRASDQNGQSVGVFGLTSSTHANGAGVFGQAARGAAKGVWGLAQEATAWAGYFDGKVHVNGTLSKAAGSFRIDHPLDPMNKYLSHSFVESPDMMNIYNGNVILNGNGEASITLPDWFSALNKDYRYQLTAIGKPSPNLYVADEVRGNQFRIAGGTPGAKISWQVTGIRNDTYAREHRIQVEELKPATERNTLSTNSKMVISPAGQEGERARP